VQRNLLKPFCNMLFRSRMSWFRNHRVSYSSKEIAIVVVGKWKFNDKLLFSRTTGIIAILNEFNIKFHKKIYKDIYSFSTCQILLQIINHIRRERNCPSCDTVILLKNIYKEISAQETSHAKCLWPKPHRSCFLLSEKIAGLSFFVLLNVRIKNLTHQADL
jgi:hypothetical protein